jgi:hypothetical protein
MEQVLPARFAVAAIQHEEVTALAQAAVEDFLAHDVPGVGDIHADKDDRNDLAFGVFNGLILGDIAFAKQQRQAAVDFPLLTAAKAGLAVSSTVPMARSPFSLRREVATRTKSLPLRTNSVEMAPVRFRKSSERVLFSCSSVSPPFSSGTLSPLIV